MKTDWIIHPLLREEFSNILSGSDAKLRSQGVQVHMVDQCPGYPCRVSLQDLPIGEIALLFHFQHHKVFSLYRASVPVFVGKQSQTASPEPNTIPSMLKMRSLSIRAYDSSGDMVCAEVVLGSEVESALDRFFDNDDIKNVHIHFARQGCYVCRVERA